MGLEQHTLDPAMSGSFSRVEFKPNYKSFYTEKQGAPTRTHPAKSHRQQRYVQQGVPRRERSVFL